MKDRSVFVHTRQQGDCGDSPVNAVFYSGATADVPVVQAGNLVFKGAISDVKARGIGFDGPALNNNWPKLPLFDVLTGGAGVKIRACNPSRKKKMRFKCCSTSQCNDSTERTAIEVRAISNCEFPKWQTWVGPKEVYFQCGCTESCCQKLRKLESQFNMDADSPVTATVVNIGTDWFIELESKVAGLDFHVLAVENLTEGDIIVPNFQQGFTAKSMKGWFGADIVGPCDPDKCMTVVEVFFWDRVVDRGFSGTTNPATDPSKYDIIKNQFTLVFDKSNANSLAAFNATLTALTGTDERNKRLVSTEASDFPVFHYCIIRTDAGSLANLETARTGYTTGVISLSRQFYVNGKSYYTLVSTSDTPPTPITIGENVDVVNRGGCGIDDRPCLEPDGCPEITDSTCLSC